MKFMKPIIYTMLINLIPILAFGAEPILKKSQSEYLKGCYCIPDTEFAIGGIKHTDNETDIVRKLGNPIRIEGTVFKRYYYLKVTVDFCQGGSVGIVTTSNMDVRTKSGIHPGMQRDEVFNILGINSILKNEGEKKKFKEQVDLEDLDMQFPNCSEDFTSIEFKFDKNNILTEISTGMDCP